MSIADGYGKLQLCGGCGYPTLGVDLCSFCEQVSLVTGVESTETDPPAA
jgi:hypothetical protein